MIAGILWAVLLPTAALAAVYLVTRAVLIASREARVASDEEMAALGDRVDALAKELREVREWADGKQAVEIFSGRQRA